MPACLSLLVMVCQKERNVAPIDDAIVTVGECDLQKSDCQRCTQIAMDRGPVCGGRRTLYCATFECGYRGGATSVLDDCVGGTDPNFEVWSTRQRFLDFDANVDTATFDWTREWKDAGCNAVQPASCSACVVASGVVPVPPPQKAR
jgi:hypothetical protein